LNIQKGFAVSKENLSVGDDTPTGEPVNGPKGPYITDKDDGTVRERPNKKRPLPSRTETEIARKSEIGSDRAGLK
jgi:hypothetical protein